MDAYNKAAGAANSYGSASARLNRIGYAYGSILPSAEAELARRIGRVRRQRVLGVAGLEAAAGRLIDGCPACSRRVSLLVDRIVVARDLALWEGRS